MYKEEIVVNIMLQPPKRHFKIAFQYFPKVCFTFKDELFIIRGWNS